MKNQQGAAPALDKAMPEGLSLAELEELETVDVTRARNTVITAFRIFNRHDLVICAETVLTLSHYEPEGPFDKCTDAELRSLLTQRAEVLYREEPQRLITVQNFVDAIARARIIKCQSKRSSARS